jgi:APA family basic amino acid/polyamine antiporter
MSRGIRESMWVSLLCALIEAGGLVLLILVGMSYWSSIDYLDTPAVAGGEPAALLVMQSVVFAFAFIGFEDMMYLTEETREPERTLPLGLILACMRDGGRRISPSSRFSWWW